EFAVRREGSAPGQPLIRQAPALPPRGRFEEGNRLFLATTGKQGVAVGGEGHPTGFLAPRAPDSLAGGDVQEPDRTTRERRRGQEPAVGGEGQSPDAAVAPGQPVHLFARRQVVKTDPDLRLPLDVIGGTGNQQLAVGGKGELHDPRKTL